MKETKLLIHPVGKDVWVSGFLARNLAYEPFETRWVRHLVRPADVVLDLGAHIGYYTLLLSQLVGPRGQVHAFEPEPANFRLLERNVALNGFGNVLPHNCAVSDREGPVTLFLSEDNAGDHRTWQPADARSTVSARAVVLDEFLWSADLKVNFIKMDMQGGEGAALRGMKRIIRQQPQLTLFTEYWPHGLEQAESSAHEVLNGLSELGFELFIISEARRSLIQVQPADLLANFSSSPDAFANLLCIKR